MAKPPDQVLVERKLAQEVLNTIRGPHGDLLGDALYEAVEDLDGLVQDANGQIRDSELANLVAHTVAKANGIKGEVHLRVLGNGDVAVEGASAAKKAKEKLPKLKEIKSRARKMGMSEGEIAAFGIRRRELWEHLESMEDIQPMSAGPDETRTHPPLDKPKRGFLRTGPALSVIPDVTNPTGKS